MSVRQSWRPTISELAREAGISRETYYLRRRAGFSHEDALALPPRAGLPLRKRTVVNRINAALRAWR